MLEILADDEGSKEDVPAWCYATGNKLLGIEEEVEGYKVYYQEIHAGKGD